MVWRKRKQIVIADNNTFYFERFIFQKFNYKRLSLFKKVFSYQSPHLSLMLSGNRNATGPLRAFFKFPIN